MDFSRLVSSMGTGQANKKACVVLEMFGGIGSGTVALKRNNIHLEKVSTFEEGVGLMLKCELQEVSLPTALLFLSLGTDCLCGF
jgi:hypothetical protein